VLAQLLLAICSNLWSTAFRQTRVVFGWQRKPNQAATLFGSHQTTNVWMVHPEGLDSG
jgi:hypothetical protein